MHAHSHQSGNHNILANHKPTLLADTIAGKSHLIIGKYKWPGHPGCYPEGVPPVCPQTRNSPPGQSFHGLQEARISSWFPDKLPCAQWHLCDMLRSCHEQDSGQMMLFHQMRNDHRNTIFVVTDQGVTIGHIHDSVRKTVVIPLYFRANSLGSTSRSWIPSVP